MPNLLINKFPSPFGEGLGVRSFKEIWDVGHEY